MDNEIWLFAFLDELTGDEGGGELGVDVRSVNSPALKGPSPPLLKKPTSGEV